MNWIERALDNVQWQYLLGVLNLKHCHHIVSWFITKTGYGNVAWYKV